MAQQGNHRNAILSAKWEMTWSLQQMNCKGVKREPGNLSIEETMRNTNHLLCGNLTSIQLKKILETAVEI